MAGGDLQDKPWGQKVICDSAFYDICTLVIDVAYRNADGPMQSYAALAVAMLKQALLDAETEVERDPDSFGPYQQALLSGGGGEMEIRTRPDDGSDTYLTDEATAWNESEIVEAPDTVALFCHCLGVHPENFRTAAATVLDQIADRVRTERETPSATVICIERERQRRVEIHQRLVEQSRRRAAEMEMAGSLIHLVDHGKFTGQYSIGF